MPPKPRQLQRMLRPFERPENRGLESVPIVHDRPDPTLVGGAVGTQMSCGAIDRALEYGNRTVVERVGQRDGGFDELETIFRQRQGAKKRRRGREGMERVTNGMGVMKCRCVRVNSLTRATWTGVQRLSAR